MRNAYLAVDVIIAFGLSSLAVVSLVRGGYKNSINRLFTALSVLVALWIVSNDISNNIAIPSGVALFADYIVFSASFGAVILLMLFVISLSSVSRLEKFVKHLYIPLWGICILSATPLVAAGVAVQSGVYAVIFGPLIWLYGIGQFFMIGVITYGLIHGLRHNSGIKRRQIKTFGIGLAFSVPLVLLFSFIIPAFTGDFTVTVFGITPMLIVVISLYYGVVRYQLFDIRQALVRTVTYAFSLLTLSAIYYSVAYVLSTALFNNSGVNTAVGLSPINIGIALVLAFIFQPIKRFFDKITNRIFYKDNYNTDDFFAKLNKTLSTTTDLRGLLERVSYEIGTTLKAEQAFFFIFTTPDGHFITAGTEGHKLLPKHDAVLFEQKCHGNGHVFVASMFDDNDLVRRMMASHRIELVLPLIQDDAVIGYLCLGEHKTSKYTSRDIRALNTISDELVIAIQNALAVHEVRELNASLQQKIANATKELRSSNAVLRKLDEIKDEFISMASHQLRTPLTSVKGYISMVIEGDVGKITPAQKQLLDQAFMSSENMVHLINDFLNVSRIQSGKFVIDKTDVDLSVMVEEEMNGLRPNATARGMKLVYKKPNKFPIVSIDEGKFRQVVMNFTDNAIYYSHENSSIVVSLGVEKNDIVFTVKDTGIGVPKKEQEKLFAKFYRAANAKVQRPDGTGVGIYLAKKVIDAHGGQVIFESTEGKGSTFGFRLPLPKLKA